MQGKMELLRSCCFILGAQFDPRKKLRFFQIVRVLHEGRWARAWEMVAVR